MSNRPDTFKINVSCIIKDEMFRGAKGVYLDCAMFPLRNGPDKDGNTHFVCQSMSKESRAKGIKGPIIGNARIGDAQPQASAPARSTPKPLPRDVDDSDPF